MKEKKDRQLCLKFFCFFRVCLLRYQWCLNEQLLHNWRVFVDNCKEGVKDLYYFTGLILQLLVRQTNSLRKKHLSDSPYSILTTSFVYLAFWATLLRTFFKKLLESTLIPLVISLGKKRSWYLLKQYSVNISRAL